MITFWIISVIMIAPYMWATSKAAGERRFTDALLQTIVLMGMLIHFSLFWSQYYMGNMPESWEKNINCCATVLLLPVIYIYAARRIHALHAIDVIVMMVLALHGIAFKGVINLGMGEMPDVKPMLLHTVFCYNDSFVISLKSQNISIVTQGLYGLYKMGLLVYKLRNTKYQYSDNYAHFIQLAVVGVVLSILSLIPENDIWFDSPLSVIYCIVMFMILGTAYAFLALRMDVDPLLDMEGEPVLINAHERFHELKENFLVLMQEKKAFLEDDITLESIARRLNTNRTYLSQMIKEHLNSTFNTYVNDQRVKHAMALMKENGESMKIDEVAWNSGFASANTFNKAFKQHTGMSPGAWRRAVEEE